MVDRPESEKYKFSGNLDQLNAFFLISKEAQEAALNSFILSVDFLPKSKTSVRIEEEILRHDEIGSFGEWLKEKIFLDENKHLYDRSADLFAIQIDPNYVPLANDNNPETIELRDTYFDMINGLLDSQVEEAVVKLIGLKYKSSMTER
jgi:hypothetical protein